MGNIVRWFLGSQKDSYTKDTLGGRTKQLLEHVHSIGQVYPSLAGGVVVTAGVGAWTLGNYVVIVPAGVIIRDHDVHYVSIEGISTNDAYELVLYTGPNGSEVEVGRVRFVKNAVQSGTQNVPFQSPLCPCLNQLKAKLASGAGGNTATIALMYHEY